MATWDPRCGFGFRSIQTSKAAAAYQPDVLYLIRTRGPRPLSARYPCRNVETGGEMGQ